MKITTNADQSWSSPNKSSQIDADEANNFKPPITQNPMLSDAIFKPMLFSTPMIQAILNGTKTQTRRIVKPQPIDNTKIDGNFYEGNCKDVVKVDGHPNWKNQFVFQCSKIKKGDFIWVRETWQQHCDEIETNQDWSAKTFTADGTYVYKANGYVLPKDSISFGKWKPSIFMPKSACRLFLEVTDVRIERLQDITEIDALAEGVENCIANIDFGCRAMGMRLFRNYERKDNSLKNYPHNGFELAQDSFETLWDSINKNWLSNPYVWVYTFKVVECPLGFR